MLRSRVAAKISGMLLDPPPPPPSPLRHLLLQYRYVTVTELLTSASNHLTFLSERDDGFKEVHLLLLITELGHRKQNT